VRVVWKDRSVEVAGVAEVVEVVEVAEIAGVVEVVEVGDVVGSTWQSQLAGIAAVRFLEPSHFVSRVEYASIRPRS
jgi:hypothetical protein